MNLSELAKGPTTAFDAIDRLSRAHYRGMTAVELLGRARYASGPTPICSSYRRNAQRAVR